MDELRFDGRVAVVTGAGHGLGRAHAWLLASRGARVVVNDLGTPLRGEGTSSSAAEEVVAEITAAGGEAVADCNDVRPAEGGRAIIQTALDSWGRVDILINNAGVLDDAPFLDASDDHVDRTIATHLRGAFSVTRPAWEVMAAQGYGRIVNTSSGAVFGTAAGMAYQSAKAGVIGLTRSLALAGAPVGICVNALLPTAFTRMTDSIPDPRFHQFMQEQFTPERAAAVAAVLAHESCAVSGECILAGGGRAARLVLAVTPGYISEAATPEDFAAHLADIVEARDLFVPRDRMDEFASYTPALGFDLAAGATIQLVGSQRDAE